jgi:hypothetical protein
MGWMRFAVVLTIVLLSPAKYDRLAAPVQTPDELAGPWETQTPSGIRGIYLLVREGLGSQPDSHEITWQTLEVNVYQRRDGKTSNGWAAAKYEPSSEAAATSSEPSSFSFSDNHLRLVYDQRSELGAIDLDLTYRPSAHSWSGTWTQSGTATSVELVRPEKRETTPASRLIGDWTGEPDSTVRFPRAKTTLCIRQSSDGVITAWLNRDLTVNAIDPSGKRVQASDVRWGETLVVESFEDGKLHLRTDNAMGGGHDYNGAISPDGSALTGTWTQESGGSLNAQANFHLATP